MIRSASYSASALAVALTAAAPAQADAQARDDRAVALAADSLMRTLGRAHGEAVWPGFRPDTVPVAYDLGARGTLLAGWRGGVPEGFAALPGADGVFHRAGGAGGASTAGTIGERGVAFVAVRSERRASLAGLAAHEAFHVHEAAVRRPGGRFGQGENSFLVATYPVFDADNASDVALEGRLLREALDAPDSVRAAALAREFLAVREARHRRLGGDEAMFERQGELHEGLAEYVQARFTTMAESALGEDVGRYARTHREALHGLATDHTRSIRLRFYVTGVALATLLDRLDPGWKAALLANDIPLQDALARASGYRAVEDSLRAGAVARHGDQSALTVRALAELRALRAAQADSILAAPGVRVDIAADSLGGSFGFCGIDPQNLLQGDGRLLLHTRWVRLCSGAALVTDLGTGVVHDRQAGIASLIVPASVTVRAAAEPLEMARGESRLVRALEIRAEGVAIDAPAARVLRTADGWRIVPVRR